MATVALSRSARSIAGRYATKCWPTTNSLLLTRQAKWMSSYPPHQVVGLPSLSPTMESGSIASWAIGEGDAFNPGDIFCSVETDKATVEFEAQDEGVLAKILKQAGSDEIKVGQPIMVIVDNEGDVAAFKDFTLSDETSGSSSSSGSEPSVDTAADSEPAPSASGAATSPQISDIKAPTSSESTSTPSTTPSTPTTSSSSSSSGGRVVASPLAYKLAKEMGHNIAQISGTGPGGRVVAADVKEYVPAAAGSSESTPEQQQQAAPAQSVMQDRAASPPVAGDGYTDYPISETAQEMAARLTQSKRNVPHYYLTVDIRVDKLLATRAQLNDALGKDASLGVYELLLKAAALSMKAVPSANASWMESVVRVYDDVDINVVLGSGDDLITPVLRNVGSKGLRAISQELNTAVDSLSSSEGEKAASGLGTFTVLNLGMYGTKSCAPIIREPQACALALGAMENRIVPSTDPAELYEQAVMLTATLSCDHRVVDGAVGAQWLAAFKNHVENPTTLLL